METKNVTQTTTSTKAIRPLTIISTKYKAYLGLKQTCSKVIGLQLRPTVGIRQQVTELLRHLLILADNSGSMHGVIEIVKALFNTLFDKIPRSGEKNFLTLVKFDSDSKVVYSNLKGVMEKMPDLSATQVRELVNMSLNADGMTNTSEGFKTVSDVSLKNTDIPTWIIHLTDGEPTAGTTQIPELVKEIKDLMDKLKHSTLVNLGMGGSYNEQFLSQLGQLTHVTTGDQIIDIVGNLVYKITNAICMNTKIQIEGQTDVVDIGTLTHEDSYLHLIPVTSDMKTVKATVTYTGMDLNTYTEEVEVSLEDEKTYETKAPIGVIKQFMLDTIATQQELFHKSNNKSDTIHGLKGVVDMLDFTLFKTYELKTTTDQEKKELKDAEDMVRDAIKECQKLAENYELSIRMPTVYTEETMRGVYACARAATAQTTLVRDSSAAQTAYRQVVRGASESAYAQATAVPMPRGISQPPLSRTQAVPTPYMGVPLSRGGAGLQRSAASSGGAGVPTHLPVPPSLFGGVQVQRSAADSTSIPEETNIAVDMNFDDDEAGVFRSAAE